MVIEVNWGVAASAVGVVGGIAKVVHYVVGRALDERDQAIKTVRAEFQRAEECLKENQRKVWEKYDALVREFQDYKLHVAETYVCEAKVEKVLAPLVERLKAIEEEMRDRRAPQ